MTPAPPLIALEVEHFGHGDAELPKTLRQGIKIQSGADHADRLVGHVGLDGSSDGDDRLTQ
jgi:hypothetical protein